MDEIKQQALDLTAVIVAAFVSNNSVRSAELSDLIRSVHASIASLGQPQAVEEPAPAPTPAVPVKKSIAGDYLICLDDGKKFQTLKRHLAQLGMTPDEYRTKWGLPADYPMVAPGYSTKRSELAKAMGLGSERRKASAMVNELGNMSVPDEGTVEPDAAIEAEVESEMVAEPVKKSRGRPKKAA